MQVREISWFSYFFEWPIKGKKPSPPLKRLPMPTNTHAKRHTPLLGLAKGTGMGAAAYLALLPAARARARTAAAGVPLARYRRLIVDLHLRGCVFAARLAPPPLLLRPRFASFAPVRRENPPSFERAWVACCYCAHVRRGRTCSKWRGRGLSRLHRGVLV